MHILFLAYYFPPESSSGSFRPLFFANELSEKGHQVTVVTAKQGAYLSDQPLDPDLVKQVSSSIEIIRCAVFRPRELLIRIKTSLSRNLKPGEVASSTAVQDFQSRPGKFQRVKDFITDILATPDPHVGWLPFAVWSASKVVRKNRCDVIYATGSPWSGLLSGVVLKLMSGKPLIADFRDPWVSNPNFSVRTAPVKIIDRFFERRVVKHADIVIANTQELQEDFKKRYPELCKNKVTVITNGFEDYAVTDKPGSVDTEVFTITHAGALYFSRNPSFLLTALRELIADGAIPAQKIQLKFVGGINVAEPNMSLLLRDPLLANSIRIIPRVSFEEAKQYMTKSHVLLLIQPDFPLQIPRKLYDYMSVRKPVFAICENASATSSIIGRFSLGYQCQNVVMDIKETLLSMYQDWENDSLRDFSDDRCDKFMNKHLAEELHSVMTETLAVKS